MRVELTFPIRALVAAGALAAIAALGAPAVAQDVQQKEISLKLPQDAVTEQSVDLPDRKLQFKATAGSLPITNDKGQILAEMAYVAYTLNGTSPERRPVTFALNGGPGSSSVWLHIGAMGPWRMRMEEAALSPSAPAPLLPNADTWLDFTDLVFIDPVGTGYSQITTNDDAAGAKGDDKGRRRGAAREGNKEEGGPRYFWSVNGDVESISEFIHKWLQKSGRLGSPKLLVGESYGGFRGPKIARTLQSDYGVGLNALVLVSPVLDFAGRRSGQSIMSMVTLLPSLAAAEMERRGETVTRERLRQVEDYARDDFMRDLMRGPRDGEARSRIVAKVADITGLPLETVSRYGGRISGRIYDREVNRPKGKVASMYDASFKGLDPNPTSGSPYYRDPFTSALNVPMTTAMQNLLAERLNYRTERPYVKMSSSVNRSWVWGNSPSSPESFSDLKEALATDPHLRVIVAHGFTDLVTPYFASELVLDQLPAYGDNQRVTEIVYQGGHMFYSRDGSRRQFREDALNLVERIIVEVNEAKQPAAAVAN